MIKNLLLELPSDVVTYNSPVRCVHWNNTEKQSPVKVECDDGQWTTADHVIVTVSLGLYSSFLQIIEYIAIFIFYMYSYLKQDLRGYWYAH